MTLIKLFDISYRKSLTVSDISNKGDTFSEVNSIFFSIVSPISIYHGDASLLALNKVYTTDTLKIGVVGFKILDFRANVTNDEYILTITPSVFDTFELSRIYALDYLILCDLIIKEWSDRAMGFVRTLGIESVESTAQQITKEEYIINLKKRFNIALSQSINY